MKHMNHKYAKNKSFYTFDKSKYINYYNAEVS